jgi:hypothetical protein
MNWLATAIARRMPTTAKITSAAVAQNPRAILEHRDG